MIITYIQYFLKIENFYIYNYYVLYNILKRVEHIKLQLDCMLTYK